MRRKRSGVLFVLFIAACAAVAFAIALARDDRHAEISLLGSEYMTVEYGTEFEDPGVVAKSVGNSFGTFKRSPKVEITGQVDTRTLGDYVLEYTATVRDKSASVSRRVSVVDTTPPVIELKHTEGYETDWFTGYEEEGYTATDSHDGDLTDRVVCTEQGDSIIYTVSDAAGNEAFAERKIEYTVAKPEIFLTDGEKITVPASLVFVDPGYSASDSKGNDLTDRVEVKGSITPYKLGSYQFEYTIANEKGDKVTKTRTVEVVKAEKPEVIKPEEKTIYLTFDDGPGPYTGQLLDILAKYDVKATFFVTGADSDYFDMIGRAYNEGHTIGVHTYSHNYRKIYQSEQNFFEDFCKVEELIYEQTGSYTRICRFPGGSSNTVSAFNPGIMSRLVTIMNNLGYCYFDWNVSSGDAGETNSTRDIIYNIEAGCSQNVLNVVLQHDIKDYSVNAVEEVIIWGLNNGYTFRALEENSWGSHHSLFN